MKVYIDGNKYDITNFIDKHPGGSSVLNNLENEDDISQLYHSYHFNVNSNYMNSLIKQYKIDDGKYDKFATFDDGDFYSIVRKRVEMKIKDHKAPLMWYIKVILTIISIYFVSAYKCRNNFSEIICGLLTGLFSISLTFNILHDSSHYAITKSYYINEMISKIIQVITLWNHYLWFRHHVYAHHSFTGDENKDPDVKNYKPLIAKRRNETFKYNLPQWCIIPILGFLPGQYFGQVFYYYLFMSRNKLWGVPIDKNKVYSSCIEKVSYYITILFILYMLNIRLLFSISYFTVLNFLYFMCIAPDHDMYESSIINHKCETTDWGELQVRRSGNFATNYPVVCQLFGGINYQIEHHLFPSVNHIYYPEISKIVEETCREFNIPYQSISWYDSIISCLRTYKYFNK